MFPRYSGPRGYPQSFHGQQTGQGPPRFHGQQVRGPPGRPPPHHPTRDPRGPRPPRLLSPNHSRAPLQALPAAGAPFTPPGFRPVKGGPRGPFQRSQRPEFTERGPQPGQKFNERCHPSQPLIRGPGPGRVSGQPPFGRGYNGGPSSGPNGPTLNGPGPGPNGPGPLGPRSNGHRPNSPRLNGPRLHSPRLHVPGPHRHSGIHRHPGSPIRRGMKREHGPDGGPTANKKKKVRCDKRDLPENNVFSCETCDRGFKTQETYQAHIDQHEKCSVEGCQYVAAPKLVRLHYQWQHVTGLASRIWKTLETPEEIEKYRMERKRKFPTATNIAKKKAIQEIKIRRGEVLENKYFGKMRGGGRGRDRGRGGRGVGRGRQPSESTGSTDTPAGSPNNTDKEEKRGKTTEEPMVPKGTDPLALLITNPNGEINDEEISIAGQKVEPAPPGALGSLVADYGDSSSPESDDDKATKKTATANTITPRQKKIEPREESSETSPNSKAEGKNERKKNPKRRNRANQRANKKINGQKMHQPPKVKLVPSLLEKLLTNEIRHERNVLLQCVRYIVENDFFGVASDTKAETDPKTIDPVCSKAEQSVAEKVRHLLAESLDT